MIEVEEFTETLRAPPREVAIAAATPRARRLHRFPPLLWGVLMLMIVAGGLVLYGVQRQYGGVPHTVCVEGTIVQLGAGDIDEPTVTVVEVNGTPSTVAVDFNGTSVFQQHGQLSTAHLRVGQQVKLVHEEGLAKSIEIVHQPMPFNLWPGRSGP